MPELKPLLVKLLDRRDLSESEAEEVFTSLAENPEPVLVSAFLTALRAKGESLSEMVGAARAILRMARPFSATPGILVDVVGTGGDGKHTANISTLTALTVAAAGIPVAKHGNRAASSACGSADLLEALGYSVEVSEVQARNQLRLFSFTFLFAPYYHPAFRKIGEIRRILSIPTLFNVLGPLTNPARPNVQLVGVSHPSWMEKVSRALKELGGTRAWVVHGAGGSDELDLEGPNQVISLENGSLHTLRIDPKEIGLEPSPLSLVKGGSKEENRLMAQRALQGEPGPLQDVVSLNAGAALYLSGRTPELRDGVFAAREILKKGQAWTLLEKLTSRDEYEYS